MPRFLSPDWVAAFNDALADLELPPPGPADGLATQGGSFSMAQIVTGGPEGERTTVLRVTAGAVSMALAADWTEPEADVTVRLAWEDAVALATGLLSPVEALTAGRIRVRGDLSVLAAGQAALAAAQPLLRGLQAETTTS